MQTTLSGLFPRVLIPFTKAQPRVEVRVVRDHSAGLYSKVLNGEIDAALTSQAPFAIPKTCEWQVLREEPFVVLVPDGTRMRHPHTILTNEPFIRLDRKVNAGQLIDNYLRKAGIRPNERLELDGLDAIAVMVDRGLGVSLLPDWAPPWPEGLTLRKIALPDRSFTRRIGLLWMRASLRIGLIRAFLRQAHRTFDTQASAKRHDRRKAT